MSAMNCHIRHSACFAAGILLFVIPCARAQDDQQTLRNVFEKAREHSNIKAKGMPGFVLRGDVRIWVKKDTASTGRYLLVWTPSGRWKEEVAFLGYKRTRIGDGTQFWQVRSSEAENPAVTELDLLLNKSRAPKTEEGDRFNKTGAKLVAGANAQCIKQSAHPPFGWTYCFDSSSGDLIEVSSGHNTTDIAWKVDWQEHSNFQEWSGNRVPLLLQGYNGKHTVLEVKFEEIKPLPQLPADFFASPTEATIWADCSDGTIWKLKERIQPEYPQSARMQHRQGTVTLYAVIGEDGKLSGLKIAHSAGQELDQSATAAVSHWRYERTAACPEAKGRSETSIDVLYSLQN
jgi:TonB family protein